MLTKQGNKIIPGSKEAVWEIWKRQEAVPPPPPAMINSEQRLTFFLKLCNLCNCLLQPPGWINNDQQKTNQQVCADSVQTEGRRDSSSAPNLSHCVSDHHHRSAGTCIFCIVSSGVQTPSPAAVHTTCLPPERAGGGGTCKLCCLDSAGAAWARTLSMSALETSAWVLASVWALFITLPFVRPRFILWWKIRVNRGLRLHFLLWAPRWKQKHESTRVCAHTHTCTHTKRRLSGFPKRLPLY